MFVLLTQFWLGFGINYRDIKVHTVYSDLGPLIHWH